ncbi:helix-turn-helix domain-containing protein [Paenibacillus sp. OV219]|uniref:helix-turn-helix domain-containing protein n=1 Tax=Paenibacillus sp. OV219 TaxID=1884377 RepID=UPI0008B55A20|nr:helix-turn-helix transcriptional regulator [Paenibacillus sp. OV219]SEN54526.1 Helix-turn-helix [Paenibacillus sp. OV219]
MHEGKIIKLYREKAELTQEQLGLGICSDTHISKIERGITDYASEIVILLSERLGISMEEELSRFNKIKKRLYDWHDVIVKQIRPEIEAIREELEQEMLLAISDYQTLYLLLQIKYLLFMNQVDKAQRMIAKIAKSKDQLPAFESNLFKHVQGIHYLAQQHYLHAITVLKSINEKEYNNPEFYHHLAMAYHTLKSEVMAYFYAEKARNYFKELNCFLRVIDAEMLMLIQVKDDPGYEFDEVIARFENLIQSSDMCGAPDRKARVMHNLAYELYRREQYDRASQLYKQSMELKDPRTGPYLLSLEGYLKSCYDGELLPAEQLEQLAQEGLATAVSMKEDLYILLFNLLLYKIRKDETQYHAYLRDEALPLYRKFGYVFLIEQSEKQLFHYYRLMGETTAALEMAHLLLGR